MALFIKKFINNHVDTLYKELKRIYLSFDTYPVEVRMALYDMIFNLGMTNLKNSWPPFNNHIKALEWQKAANSSKRKAPISRARNKYVIDLLEKAAKNSAENNIKKP